MGRLEKIVVLTVLFLVAVILAVSLNTDSGAEVDPLATGGEELAEPLTVARGETSERASRPRPPLAGGPGEKGGRRTPEEPLGPEAGPAGLLNAPIEIDPAGARPIVPPVREGSGSAAPTPAAEVPEPAPEPVEENTSFLRTTSGLEATLVDELMVYTWKEGDTFTKLADRYYGSRKHVNRLRHANEGADDTRLAVGDQILVPVLPAKPATRGGEEGSEWDGGSTYVVEAGDLLGTISQKVYGTAKKWRKIYDANADVLSDPNKLDVGMVLRIPPVD